MAPQTRRGNKPRGDDNDERRLVRRVVEELEGIGRELCVLHAKVETGLERIAVALEARPDPQGDGRTNIQVVEVEPKEIPTMPPTPVVDHMQKFTLHATNRSIVLAVTGPKLTSGEYAGEGEFVTDDDVELPLQQIAPGFVQQPDPAWVDPDPAADPPNVAPLIDVLDEQGRQIPLYKVRAMTPLEPDEGTYVGGTVRWDSAGMRSVDIEIEYGTPPLGRAVISVDTEAEVV